MTKIFVVNSYMRMEAQESSLINPRVSGATIYMPAASFMAGRTGFYTGTVHELNKQLKWIAGFRKEAGIAVQFGNDARNIEGVNYMNLVISRQNMTTDPEGITVPIFWEKPYMDYLRDFIYWFGSELKKDAEAYKAIKYIYVTGINQTTPEFRVPYCEMTTSDPTKGAAEKWAAVGYTPQKVKDSIVQIMRWWKNVFPDKELVLPIIGGINGFPAVGEDGTVLTDYTKRVDISKYTVEIFCRMMGIIPMWTALGSHLPPNYMLGQPSYYQLYAQLYGNNVKIPPYIEVFNKLIADDANKVVVEIFEADVKRYLS